MIRSSTLIAFMMNDAYDGDDDAYNGDDERSDVNDDDDHITR